MTFMAESAQQQIKIKCRLHRKVSEQNTRTQSAALAQISQSMQLHPYTCASPPSPRLPDASRRSFTAVATV